MGGGGSHAIIDGSFSIASFNLAYLYFGNNNQLYFADKYCIRAINMNALPPYTYTIAGNGAAGFQDGNIRTCKYF